MRILRTLLATTVLFAAPALALTAATAQDNTQKTSSDPSIPETVQNNASAFAVANLLIERAGLAETLAGEGPYTLFAPTDEAFDKLPVEQFQALLDPANKEVLVELLKNHVVEGRLTGGDFIDKTQEVTTLAGNTIKVEGKGELLLRNAAAPRLTTHEGKVALEPAIIEASVPLVKIIDAGGGAVPGEGGDDGVDASVVILPDLTAGNGIIHAVSDVLVPKGALDKLKAS